MKLQKRDGSLVKARKKDQGGKTELKANESISSGDFRGVDPTETIPKIKKSQVYQSIIDNLTRRLPDSELVTILKPLDQH